MSQASNENLKIIFFSNFILSFLSFTKSINKEKESKKKVYKDKAPGMSLQGIRFPDFDPNINYGCRFNVSEKEKRMNPYCKLGNYLHPLPYPPSAQERYKQYLQYNYRLLEAGPQCWCTDRDPPRCFSQRLCSACDINSFVECPHTWMGWSTQ